MSESLETAISSGDEYRILVATRNIVARQLEDTSSGRDIASLSKQMQELTEKIAAMERAQTKRGKVNPLEAARKAVKNAK